MKNIITALLIAGSFSAFAKEINYLCVNKNIDPDASYYLPKYFVKIDTKVLTAEFTDENGESASDGAIKLVKFQTKDARLQNSYTGNMWSDSGCSVQAFLTKEMMAGENKAFLKVKQESECRSSGAWLSCFKTK